MRTVGGAIKRSEIQLTRIGNIREGKPQFAGKEEAKRRKKKDTTIDLLRSSARFGRKPQCSGSVTNGIVIVKKLEGQ